MGDGLLEPSLEVKDTRNSRTAAHNIKLALEHLSDLKCHVLISGVFMGSKKARRRKIVDVDTIVEIGDDKESVGRRSKASAVRLALIHEKRARAHILVRRVRLHISASESMS